MGHCKLCASAIGLLALVACASGPTRSSPFYGDQSRYDAICEDPEAPQGFRTYLDSLIVEQRGDRVYLASASGQSVASAKACAFERAAKLRERPARAAKGAKLYQAACNFGEAQFSDENLQLVEQAGGASYVRRLDGQAWIIPTEKCPLVEQSNAQGD
jgi:hypothetical protein